MNVKQEIEDAKENHKRTGEEMTKVNAMLQRAMERQAVKRRMSAKVQDEPDDPPGMGVFGAWTGQAEKAQSSAVARDAAPTSECLCCRRSGFAPGEESEATEPFQPPSVTKKQYVSEQEETDPSQHHEAKARSTDKYNVERGRERERERV